MFLSFILLKLICVLKVIDVSRVSLWFVLMLFMFRFGFVLRYLSVLVLVKIFL